MKIFMTDERKVIKHTKCRLCGHNWIQFSLDQYINDFVTEDKIGQAKPLSIVHCF